MSIEEKRDERGRLYRWACLVCRRRGMWIRDHEQVRQGMRTHCETPRHRDGLNERAARLGLPPEVSA
jgi:hypothetical protein